MNHSDTYSQTSSNNLQRRLVFLTLTITLSVGILFSCVCSTLYKEYLESSLVRSTDTNLKFLTDSIDYNLESVQRLLRWSQSNTIISEYITTATNQSYAKIAMDAHDRLTEEYQNNSSNTYFRRIVIGNYHNRFIQVVPTSYSSSENLAEVIPKQPYFDTLISSKTLDLSTGFIADPFFNGNANQVIPVIKPIYAKYNSDISGWVFLEITEDLFTEPLEYYSCADDTELFLIIKDKVYSMNKSGIKLSERNYDFSSGNEIVNTSVSRNSNVYSFQNPTHPENDIIVVRQLEETDCYIAQTISRIELQKQYSLLILLWLIIFALMFFVGAALSYLLHRMIALPIRRIQTQITNISTGNFTPDSSIEWDNELGDIGKCINLLASDIEQLLNTRIADEKEKKDLEYKVLQNQINPHFLYNTLNSIKWMATVQGAEGIADMTTSLSRLLRSISKGTKQRIPLREELSLVKDYFNIQNYRYGGTIQLEIDCEEETLMDYSIIKFTLQPLVENAIFHGLEPKGGIGTIKITLRNTCISTDSIEIIVWDNGVGMPNEQIATLLSSDENSSNDFFKEIGVSNVHKRLQYEYGTAYQIHIESVPGEYTSMHIVIPKKQI